jgi:hypothetical protein
MDKPIGHSRNGAFSIRIIFNTDWEEYQVRLYHYDGKRFNIFDDATYFTDDYVDAKQTAREMLKGASDDTK